MNFSAKNRVVKSIFFFDETIFFGFLFARSLFCRKIITEFYD